MLDPPSTLHLFYSSGVGFFSLFPSFFNGFLAMMGVDKVKTESMYV